MPPKQDATLYHLCKMSSTSALIMIVTDVVLDVNLYIDNHGNLNLWLGFVGRRLDQ